LVVGQALTKTSGTGAFGASAYILSITNGTTFVASVNNATAGAITFTAGNMDKTSLPWYTRLAIAGKTIIMESTAAKYAEIYPISAANAYDPKLHNGTNLIVEDLTISGGGIYSAITYNLDVDGLYTGSVDGTPHTFAGYIEANNQTNESVHAKVNWMWRQTSNVNSDGAGAVKRGDKQPPLTAFSGDVFTVKSYLLNYKASQRNNLRLVDTSVATWQWPTAYTLTVNSAALAVGGTFSLIHEDTYGTSNAVYLKNDLSVDQKDIAITASKDITIAYSTYNIGGHVAGQPLPLRLTWNKPGAVEPSNLSFTFSSDSSVTISPTADPSYI